MKNILRSKLIFLSSNKILEFKTILYIKGQKGVLQIQKNNLFNLKNLGSLKRHMQNALIGTDINYIQRLFFNGVGYRAELNDKILILRLGYSHTLNIQIPKSIEVFIAKRNHMNCKSYDLAHLRLFISRLQKLRKFDVYKGKGLLLKNQIFKLKEGKKKK